MVKKGCPNSVVIAIVVSILTLAGCEFANIVGDASSDLINRSKQTEYKQSLSSGLALTNPAIIIPANTSIQFSYFEKDRKQIPTQISSGRNDKWILYANPDCYQFNFIIEDVLDPRTMDAMLVKVDEFCVESNRTYKVYISNPEVIEHLGNRAAVANAPVILSLIDITN